jgi:hypothetical protein
MHLLTSIIPRDPGNSFRGDLIGGKLHDQVFQFPHLAGRKYSMSDQLNKNRKNNFVKMQNIRTTSDNKTNQPAEGVCLAYDNHAGLVCTIESKPP